MPPGAKYSEMSKIHALHLQPVLSINFVATPAFYPIIDGALSVAILTSREQFYSDPVQLSNERVENIIGCYGIHHRHQPQELISDRRSLINTTNKYS